MQFINRNDGQMYVNKDRDLAKASAHRRTGLEQGGYTLQSRSGAPGMWIPEKGVRHAWKERNMLERGRWSFAKRRREG